jgi:hypothetical protein
MDLSWTGIVTAMAALRAFGRGPCNLGESDPKLGYRGSEHFEGGRLSSHESDTYLWVVVHEPSIAALVALHPIDRNYDVQGSRLWIR